MYLQSNPTGVIEHGQFNGEANMCRLVAVAFLIMCGALASPAFAETESAAQRPARTNVEVRAAQVGSASTEAQAVQDQATLMPAVKAAVKAGVTKSLMEHTSNPSVAADLVRVAGKVYVEKGMAVKKKPAKPAKGITGPAEPGEVEAPTTHSEAPPKERMAEAARRRFRAHTAGCYGQANSTGWVELEGLGTVSWVYVGISGWCGEWYGLTAVYGLIMPRWVWGPFCLANEGTNYTYDGSYAWIHMANWASFGINYAFGCWTYAGEKAVLRIADNGYWDRYNDYGF